MPVREYGRCEIIDIMLHAPTIRRIAALTLAALCWTAFPVPGWSWGWDTHHYIAQNYSQHLPPYIDGLRAYDGTVDDLVTDADARRPSTPGEAERHYIDIDFYPEFLAGTLSHDRAALEAQYGVATVIDVGILPWAVGEVVVRLTEQFQAGEWGNAAVTIADLCHYVGDACQPLHCTMNYNGQLTGNNGIHSRYETTMMSPHIDDLFTAPMPVTHFPDAVDAMFDVISTSWVSVDLIIQADDNAKIASGGSYNSVYYASLWSSTESMTREQVDTATLATASFVFTAWVDAGRPSVPGSSTDVGPALATGARLAAGPSPFREEITIRFGGQGPLSLDVFDLRGRRVERLVERGEGQGTVSWRPAGGVAPGIYFIRLAGPQVNIVRRVALID